MFEAPFLGQVRLRMGQSQSSPTPSSSDPRFAVPADDQRFTPLVYGPFLVPMIAGLPYPPQYPPDRFDCVVSDDGRTWICTPKVGVPAPISIGPGYPVVPLGRSF
jgi:hypothetical protein